MSTINDMSSDEFFRMMRDVLRGKDATSVGGGGRTAGIDAADITALKNAIKGTIEQIKKTQPAYKSLEGIMNKQMLQLDDMSDAFEDLETAMKKTEEITDAIARTKAQTQIQEMKSSLVSAQRAKASAVALNNLGVSALSLVGSFTQSAFDFAKGLQSGADGVTIGTQASVNAVKMTGESMSSMVGVVNLASTALIGMTGPIGWVAKGLLVIGTLLLGALKKGTEASAAALEYLGEELKKNEKAFNEIGKAGATFANGMTEMRSEAVNAGLDVAQFAAVIKNSQTDLVAMGLGMGDAAKRLGGISKELRSSNLGMELRLLGYSVEEQAELGAQVAATLNSSGTLRATSDEKIALMTNQYGKDLKVLQGITGEDAKKAMEKARLASQEADIMAQLQAKGPDAVAKFQAQLAATPEGLRKGFMEFISTNGEAVTDAATNIAMSQNPKIKEMWDQQLSTIGDGSKKAKDALDETNNYLEQIGKYAAENMDTARVITNANRLGGQGLDNITKVLSEVLNLRLREPGSAAKMRDTVESSATNKSELDVNIASLNDTTQKLRVALADNLTDSIATFADSMARGVDTIDAALSKLGVKDYSKTEDTKKKATAKAKAEENMYDFEKESFNLGGRTSDGSIVGAGLANGGFASGPDTGFMQLLHGTELVIPLDSTGKLNTLSEGYSNLLSMIGGTSASAPPQSSTQTTQPTAVAPTSSNASNDLIEKLRELIVTAQDQLAKQDEMLRAMNDTKDYTERLYHVMA